MSKKTYQSGEYLSHNPTWHVEDSPWKAGNIMKMINRHKLQLKNVAEVGCGAGEILKQMSLAMPDAVQFAGYEISQDAIDLCQERTGPNLRFELADLLEESNQDYFDLLLIIDVIEHVENCLSFSRKCREKAKYKIFHIPLDMSVQSVFRVSPIMNNRASVGHIHYFSKETALATLEDSGYKIIDYFYTASGLDLSSISWKGQLMKLPRKLLFAINQDFAVRLLGGHSLMVLAE